MTQTIAGPADPPCLMDVSVINQDVSHLFKISYIIGERERVHTGLLRRPPRCTHSSFALDSDVMPQLVCVVLPIGDACMIRVRPTRVPSTLSIDHMHACGVSRTILYCTCMLILSVIEIVALYWTAIRPPGTREQSATKRICSFRA